MSESVRTTNASVFCASRIVELVRISTLSARHSCSSIPVMSCADLSQNNWPSFFIVIRDTVLLNQGYEVCGSVSGQCRFSEMRIGSEKVVGSGVQVREIAASATRDQDLFADALGVFKNQHPPAAFAGFDGTH